MFKHASAFLRAFTFFTLVLLAHVTLGQSALEVRLVQASPDTIQADPALQARVNELARAAVNEHCASCHGADLTGKPGVPNLVDFDWNWGVTGYELTQGEAVFEIMQTILYGVRSDDCPEELKRYGGCPDTRFSQMPGYLELELTQAQVNGLVDYVYALAGMEHDQAAIDSVAKESTLCSECHGEDGTGYKAFGGPDLTDDVWLYGSSRDVVYDVIANGRTGQCPAWWQTLDAATVKALAMYIYNQYMGF